MAKKTQTAPAPATPRRDAKLAKLIREMLAERDAGSRHYREAERLLDVIAAKMQVGDQIDLGGGRVAVMVDNFATKNKVWKSVGVARLELEITDVRR